MKYAHQKLEVWKAAMELATHIFQICRTFPKSDQFALTNQVWRAAISVPSNIAEGAARGTRREFLQFVIIARGSLSEVQTQLLIAVNIGYLAPDDGIFSELDHVFRLINGLKRHLSSSK